MNGTKKKRTTALHQPLENPILTHGKDLVVARRQRTSSSLQPISFPSTATSSSPSSEVKLHLDGFRLRKLPASAPANNFRKLLVIVMAAIAIRLLVLPFLIGDQLGPRYEHYKMGFETGRIARSILQGEGFSSPLFERTGPTAWMTPVYPCIVAGFFKVFGLYTKRAAYAILIFQALTSALTCVPMFFFARKTFGEKVAKWSAWAWAVFPYAIYFPLDRIWETWLSTLLLCVLLLVSLNLEEARRLSAWLGAGLLWGVAALTSAAVLTVWPFLQAIISYRRWKQGRPWLLPNLAMGLAFVAVVTPWFVRNYRTFHAFVPFRDNMGIVLLMGVKGQTDYWEPNELGPWKNEAEIADYHRLGEFKYMAAKKAQALDFIKTHRRWYAWTTLRRFIFLWTGYWSLDKSYLAIETWDPENILFCSAFTILALWGLVKAWRQRVQAAFAYTALLVAFPAIYYITSPESYYRRPLDPIMLVLAVYALVPSRSESPIKDLDQESAVEAPAEDELALVS